MKIGDQSDHKLYCIYSSLIYRQTKQSEKFKSIIFGKEFSFLDAYPSKERFTLGGIMREYNIPTFMILEETEFGLHELLTGLPIVSITNKTSNSVLFYEEYEDIIKRQSSLHEITSNDMIDKIYKEFADTKLAKVKSRFEDFYKAGEASIKYNYKYADILTMDYTKENDSQVLKLKK